MVFPFLFPLLSVQSLPNLETFTGIEKEKLLAWLDFPLLRIILKYPLKNLCMHKEIKELLVLFCFPQYA